MAFFGNRNLFLENSGCWKFGCKKGTQLTRKFGGTGKNGYSIKKHRSVIGYTKIKAEVNISTNLFRFAHLPEAENDGKIEYWNLGFVWHRIEKYHDL